MSRVTINIRFSFQKEHSVNLIAYIPRAQAISIPHLNLQQRQKKEVETQPKGKQKSQSNKKESDEEQWEEEDNKSLPNEIQNQNEMIDEREEEGMDAQQQNEVYRALEEMQEENDFDLESDEDDDLENSDSLSKSLSLIRPNANKTKRQKGDTNGLVQLPDRRPRKDKKVDEANEMIRREEKQRKRKQYLKKQVQALQKATLQKILNETGRKLKMRQEKEIKQELDRFQKAYRTLGDVPKIVMLDNESGRYVMLHKTNLFPQKMISPPLLRMKEICQVCGETSKYKLKGEKHACSLQCYKTILSQ